MLPRFLLSLMTRDFDGFALEDVEIAQRTQVGLGPRQECLGAQNIDRQAALDALDHHRLDRLLLVVGLLNLVPGAQPLRLLVGEVDVTLLGLTLVAHDGDLVARLKTRLAGVVHHFGDGEHAFGLGADIHHHVGGGNLQHRALDDIVFAGSFFRLGGETLEGGGEVFGG